MKKIIKAIKEPTFWLMLLGMTVGHLVFLNATHLKETKDIAMLILWGFSLCGGVFLICMPYVLYLIRKQDKEKKNG